MTANPQTPDAAHPEGHRPDPVQTARKTVYYYWREIAAFVGILILLGIVYAMVRSSQEAAEEAAWTDLFEKTYRASAYGEANLPAALAEVRGKHKGTTAMVYAHIREMDALFLKQDFGGARKAADRFLQAFPDHALAPAVRLDRCKLLMHEEKYAEARGDLESLLDEGHQNLEPEIRLAIAQCLVREEKLEEARDKYVDITRLGEGRWPEFVPQAEYAIMLIDQTKAGTLAPAKPDLPAPAMPQGMSTPPAPAPLVTPEATDASSPAAPEAAAPPAPQAGVPTPGTNPAPEPEADAAPNAQ